MPVPHVAQAFLPVLFFENVNGLSQNLQHLGKQLEPLQRYAVKIEEGEIWVDVQ
jgi:hypothetical protein